MRRRKATLNPSEWEFYAATELPSLADILRGIVGSIFVICGSRKRVQKVLFWDRAALSRGWFQQDVDGFAMRSYNHESRTAQYVRTSDGALVTVQSYENWFPRGVDPGRAVLGFQNAKTALERESFDCGVLSSPTLTGLHAFESKLPFELPEGEPSAEWRAMLHARTTQSRTEIWLPKTVSEFYYLDRRFAYAADAVLELPCGAPVVLTGADAAPVPFETAWYDCTFRIPDDWRHVGLLPVLSEFGLLRPTYGWTWPNEGGTVHAAFVAEPELRVALASGWQVEVVRKYLFQKARPLEKPVKLLVALYERAKLLSKESGILSIEAGIYRDCVLRAIGGMYARTFERERIVDESELVEMEGAEVLTAESLGSERYSIKERAERRESRFYQPEWTAYIWSRARARLNAALLSLPYDSLIGCHVDAIYTDREPLTIQDNGRIGQFRLKGKIGSVEGPEMTLQAMGDISKMKAFAEATFNAKIPCFIEEKARIKRGE